MNRRDPPQLANTATPNFYHPFGHTIPSDIPLPILAGIPSLQEAAVLNMSDTSEPPTRRESTPNSTDNEVDVKESSTPPSKRRLVRTACLPCRKRKSKVQIILTILGLMISVMGRYHDV